MVLEIDGKPLLGWLEAVFLLKHFGYINVFYIFIHNIIISYSESSEQLFGYQAQLLADSAFLHDELGKY